MRRDRAVRAVRGGRRKPDRPREPRDGRAPVPPGRAESATRAAELLSVRPGRGGRPAGRDLLRRHAPASGPGRRAGRPATGDLPRRAHDGAGPAQPAEPVGVIEELVRAGTTVLLTTQYLDEADQLADSIAVVDRGKVIAAGRPTSSRSGWAASGLWSPSAGLRTPPERWWPVAWASSRRARPADHGSRVRWFRRRGASSLRFAAWTTKGSAARPGPEAAHPRRRLPQLTGHHAEDVTTKESAEAEQGDQR